MSKKRDIVAKELQETERINNLEKYKTAQAKVVLIKDIKTGLGVDIKNNPSKVKVIEKKWYQKIGLIFKKIFTKF